MFIIETYALAVAFCFITMLAWGSWANTQKLAAKDWRFELFYWDYVFGIVLFSLLFALSAGSIGPEGRPFWTDLTQADSGSLWSAFLGGILFNLANILLVAAITLAGMSVAFPVGIGLALVVGVIVNYLDAPVGDSRLLFAGVGMVVLAILLNANAYRKLTKVQQKVPTKGLILAVVAGLLMGLFYKYNLVFNTILMQKPFEGGPVSYRNYFQGSRKSHVMGILGGVIWCIGMSFSILASDKAGPAISYGLGQGATVVAALWGIFVWKEFKGAPKGVGGMLNAMLLIYIAGLTLIIAAR